MAKRRGSQSELRLIKRCAERIEKAEIKNIPQYMRGIYVLYKKNDKKKKEFKVVYIGLATRRIIDRLKEHKNIKKFTHFSVFDVWDNITDKEIKELEGLFRHIYKYDKKVNVSNLQRGCNKLYDVRQDKIDNWKDVCWQKGKLLERGGHQ